MFVKKRYKKLVAAVFIVQMFAVSFIQLLHVHVTKSGGIVKIKITRETDAANLHLQKEAKCFTCDYQFVKDADHSLGLFYTVLPIFFTSNNTALVQQKITSPHYGIENRGPPVLI